MSDPLIAQSFSDVQAPKARENEVPGLINFSLVWVQALAILTVMNGAAELFQIVHPLREQSAQQAYWSFITALSLFASGFVLYRYFRWGKQYVAEESDLDLGKAMVSLGTYLILVGTNSLLISLASLSELSSVGTEIPAVYRFSLFWIFSFLFLAGAFWKFLQWDEKTPYQTDTFTKHINFFALRNHTRVRTLALLMIISATALLLFTGIDKFFVGSNPPWSMTATAVGLLLVSFAVAWYRMAIREIRRNPSPVYFERTLERLNILWIVLSTFYVLRLLLIIVKPFA